jgi:hypothetical protein
MLVTVVRKARLPRFVNDRSKRPGRSRLRRVSAAIFVDRDDRARKITVTFSRAVYRWRPRVGAS